MEQKGKNQKDVVNTDINDKDVVNSNAVPEKKETFFERLNKYSNLILGIATLFLVIFTAVYIYLTWKIATETKRLADVSVEQFKIKAYPVFLLEVSQPSYENGELKDKVKVCNKGEIAAHETKILSMSIFKLKEKWLIYRDDITLYKDLEKNERVTIFNFSKKYPPDSCLNYTATKKFNENLSIKNLIYKLIYIRFKVPYDNKYSYETFAYIFEETKGKTEKLDFNYVWDNLTDDENNRLIKKHLEQITTDKDDVVIKEIQNFLIDFKLE